MKQKSESGGPFWFGECQTRMRPLDPDNAARELQDLRERTEEAGLSVSADMLSDLKNPNTSFIAAAIDLSPFLRDTLRHDPAILERLANEGLETRLEALFVGLSKAGQLESQTEAGLMRDLRKLKAEAHALIALDDLAHAGNSQVTVERLSRMADAAIGAAVRFLLVEAKSKGKLELPDISQPEFESGWIILGMGKLGASELNFSSDIDLVVFFDPQAQAIDDPWEASETFVRMTRRLVRILQDRTEHGYVFRTDLRLRPDPGATALAIPVEAALIYYESRGQNWERAAMIKARPVAGDVAAGEAFLKELHPYVWRKYMDYAAIADVHSIKRQIHAHRGHDIVAVRGHNVKLGRGGIREIEFFVQTQQLIAGGRFPELRGRQTIAMLNELAGHNWIEKKTAADLEEQYWFLRNVEHAIQIVADEQTHTLPEDDEGILRIAQMSGFADEASFSARFRAALGTVEKHYAALFETAPQLSGDMGNLVFTGEDDDPGTLETLSMLGFERPSDMARVIRTWHFGRYRATQSAEARERLTELTPALLKTFGATRRADEALLRFDEFLAGLPSGIQLFSIFQTNPALLNLLATIMGTAPRLAAIITRRPHVFDSLLDPSLISDLPTRDYLAQRLETFLVGTSLHEEVLDRLRIFTAEQKFLIGVRLLTGAIDARRAGRAFSALADLTIGEALNAVCEEFAIRHGRIPGGRVAILGMGKLGSRELTAGSDVDLILLYDHEADALESDGEKPLAPAQYYMRLTQRLIAAVSAPTAEGILYELDLRLRPSGNKGPVATHVEAFSKYQRSEAWIWEHMALTRGRMIAGDEILCEELTGEIADILKNASSDKSRIVKEAFEMRGLIAEEKPPSDDWDLKLIPGGIIDLEFIAQVARLTDAVDFPDSGEAPTSTGEILAALSEGYAEPVIRDELVAAWDLYMTLSQILRLCLTSGFERNDAPPGLVDLMLRATDLPDFAVLEAHVTDTASRTRQHFEAILK